MAHGSVAAGYCKVAGFAKSKLSKCVSAAFYTGYIKRSVRSKKYIGSSGGQCINTTAGIV